MRDNIPFRLSVGTKWNVEKDKLNGLIYILFYEL